MKPKRILRSDDDGVSDIVGSILLVAITVMMASALGVLLLNFDGPKDRPQTSLQLTVTPGNANWGNGDERIVVRNLGGERLFASQISVLYAIGTGAPTTITGSQLNFPAAGLAIGQSWQSNNLTLKSTDIVSVRVVSRGATNVVMASAVLIPAQVSAGSNCPFDSVRPTAFWDQSPPDVNVNTTTNVTLTMTVVDDCAGADQTVIPKIFWGITPGNPTDKGNMVSLGNNQWRAIVPVPPGGWSSVALQMLQYYASPLTDLRSNSGASSVRSDVIEFFGGTQHAFANYQVLAPSPAVTSPSEMSIEDGVVATLREGSVSSTLSIAPDGVVSSPNWTQTGNSPMDATTSNDGYRRYNVVVGSVGTQAEPIRFSMQNPAPGGTISAVKVVLEQRISTSALDGWMMQACTTGGTCGASTPSQPGTASDADLIFDVTNLKPPGVTSWTWTDINNLEIRLQPNRQGSLNADWRVDLVRVDVTHTTYAGGIEFNWTSVPAGSLFVDLRYSGPSDESFYVNVWNFTAGTYTTRGTLSATSLSQFTYQISGGEFSSGQVRIRIVDANPNDVTLSQFGIDYVRITRL